MGFSQYGYRSVSESAIDNEVPLYLSAANKQSVSRVSPGPADGGLDVYADEIVQEHPTGKILRLGYGPVSAPTWVMDVTKAGIAGTFLSSGPAIYDVTAYGATGTDSDQTAAIAAAVADLKSHPSQAGILFFPPGHYRTTETLDLQDMFGVTLAGSGENCTIIHMLPRPDHWIGRSIVSLAGSFNVTVRDIHISNDQTGTGSGANLPDAGLFLGQCDAHVPTSGWPYSPWGPNCSNAIHVQNVRVEGAFRYGAIVNYGVPSSSFSNVDCYLRSDNSFDGASGRPPTNDSANAAALVLTRDNPLGIQGIPGYPLIPPTMGQRASDLEFWACEFHDMVAADRGSSHWPSQTSGIWIDEGYEIAFRGGNISSGGARYMRLTGANTGSSFPGVGNQRILISKMTMYPEAAPPAPANAIELTSGPAPGGGNLNVQSLMVRDGTYMVCTQAIIKAPAGANFKGLVLRDWRESTSGFPGGRVLEFAGGGGYLSDSPDIDARNYPFQGVINMVGGAGLKQATSLGGITEISHADESIAGGGVITAGSGSTTYYGLGSANATEASVLPVRVSHGMTVFNLRVCASAAPTGGQTLTFMLRRASPATGYAFENTTLTGTVAGTSVTGSNTAARETLQPGDVLTLRVVGSAGSTPTAWLSWSLDGISTA